MPAPICVKCQVEMRCKKNNTLVNDVRVGRFQSIYWLGDLFECLVCSSSIVVGLKRGMSAKVVTEEGFNRSESITFAYSLEQREKLADQFPERKATDDIHH